MGCNKEVAKWEEKLKVISVENEILRSQNVRNLNCGISDLRSSILHFFDTQALDAKRWSMNQTGICLKSVSAIIFRNIFLKSQQKIRRVKSLPE